MLLLFCITPNPQAEILGVQKLDSYKPLWAERQALHQGTCNSITWLVARMVEIGGAISSTVLHSLVPKSKNPKVSAFIHSMSSSKNFILYTLCYRYQGQNLNMKNDVL